MAQTGCRPPVAPWSCDLNAEATSPCDLLRAGACAWWLSCCSALRVPACSPQDISGVPFHSDVLLVHPRLQQEAMAALRASAARGHDFSSWDHDHRRVCFDPSARRALYAINRRRAHTLARQRPVGSPPKPVCARGMGTPHRRWSGGGTRSRRNSVAEPLSGGHRATSHG